jgi:hypothetical protein
MQNSGRLKYNVLGCFAALALFTGQAEAAVGQTGTATLVQGWGPYTWGPGKSTARLGVYLGTTDEWTNSDGPYANSHVTSVSATWADAYLFDRRYVFWDLEGKGMAWRAFNNPDANRAYARGRILINNTNYFTTVIEDFNQREATVASPPIGFGPSRIGRSSGTFWLGPIPLTATGEVWGSLTLGAAGAAAMAVDYLDPTWIQFDSTWGALQGSGNVWGSGWVAIGDPGIVGAGIRGNLNFFSGTITPEALGVRALCAWRVPGCNLDTRASNYGRVRGTVNITSGSGAIDIFGSVFGEALTKRIISWKDPLTYNATLWDQEYYDIFRAAL